MLRPTVRLLKTLVCPLTLLVLVGVFIYTQDYFTPGYSRWLASNVFPQSPIPTAGEDKDVKEGTSCRESESKKSKTGSLYTRLTLKKSVTSSKGTDSDARAGTISTWDALFSPEYVKRREHAHNACLREGEPAEVQGDVNYVVRFGMTSDAMTPYCGLPESDVLADGSEGGVALNAMTSYCAVPKVACSFWLGVFRYLCNDTNGYHYDSPMSMSRTAIHYYDFEKIRFLNRSELHRVADDFRFVFVREPYSRLWSAYVDKLWLPDFWIDTGSIINRELRKKGLSKGHNL